MQSSKMSWRLLAQALPLTGSLAGRRAEERGRLNYDIHPSGFKDGTAYRLSGQAGALLGES